MYTYDLNVFSLAISTNLFPSWNLFNQSWIPLCIFFLTLYAITLPFALHSFWLPNLQTCAAHHIGLVLNGWRVVSFKCLPLSPISPQMIALLSEHCAEIKSVSISILALSSCLAPARRGCLRGCTCLALSNPLRISVVCVFLQVWSM